MSRLYRRLWHVEVRHADRLACVPAWPLPYEWAAVLAGLLGQEDDVRSAILRPVPGSRARWEWLAPFEASDPPRW
ncbi:MAG TPA: hypothetical protein VLM76_02230 [Patescibacteria group bacterium]|nr:hypothetical protein [Patescibacteria group bacterium]